jgi:hypothetical protein
VRKQHYNATGHSIGRTYGSFGSDELAPGHHHGKSLIETLEISCDACGNESTVTAKATKAKAFESASTFLPKELGKGGPKLPSRLAPSRHDSSLQSLASYLCRGFSP